MPIIGKVTLPGVVGSAFGSGSGDGLRHATAVSSSNYHLDHFGTGFGIESAHGAPAHSACVGFGVERITLALLARYGLDPDRWPAGVRGLLWP